MDYQDMNFDAMVDEYLSQYYTMYGDQQDFPNEEELDTMYDELYDMVMQRYPQYANMQQVSTMQFGGLLWLALIGALYRRYPYYRRRCRYGYGRGCYGRRPYGYGGYGRYGYGRYGRGYRGY